MILKYKRSSLWMCGFAAQSLWLKRLIWRLFCLSDTIILVFVNQKWYVIICKSYVLRLHYEIKSSNCVGKRIWPKQSKFICGYRISHWTSTIISENRNFSLRLGLAISHWETETTSFFFFIVLYISLIVIWRSFVTIYSNIAVKARRRKGIKEKESSRTPTSWHVMSFSKKMLMTGEV